MKSDSLEIEASIGDFTTSIPNKTDDANLIEDLVKIVRESNEIIKKETENQRIPKETDNGTTHRRD